MFTWSHLRAAPFADFSPQKAALGNSVSSLHTRHRNSENDSYANRGLSLTIAVCASTPLHQNSNTEYDVQLLSQANLPSKAKLLFRHSPSLTAVYGNTNHLNTSRRSSISSPEGKLPRKSPRELCPDTDIAVAHEREHAERRFKDRKKNNRTGRARGGGGGVRTSLQKLVWSAAAALPHNAADPKPKTK